MSPSLVVVKYNVNTISETIGGDRALKDSPRDSPFSAHVDCPICKKKIFLFLIGENKTWCISNFKRHINIIHILKHQSNSDDGIQPKLHFYAKNKQSEKTFGPEDRATKSTSESTSQLKKKMRYNVILDDDESTIDLTENEKHGREPSTQDKLEDKCHFSGELKAGAS